MERFFTRPRYIRATSMNLSLITFFGLLFQSTSTLHHKLSFSMIEILQNGIKSKVLNGRTGSELLRSKKRYPYLDWQNSARSYAQQTTRCRAEFGTRSLNDQLGVVELLKSTSLQKRYKIHLVFVGHLNLQTRIMRLDQIGLEYARNFNELQPCAGWLLHEK